MITWTTARSVYTRRSVAISLIALMTLALAVSLAAPAAAPKEAAAAVRLATGRGGVPQPYQRWADRARVPTPEATIIVLFRACPGLPRSRGCVFDDGGPPTIYLNLRHLRSERLRHYVFLHEVGHYFDFLHLRGADRDRFRRILGIDRPWRRTEPLPEGFQPTAYTPGPPAEMFAQAYAECAVKGPRIRRRPRRPMRYRYRPSPRQHELACRLISEVAPVYKVRYFVNQEDARL